MTVAVAPVAPVAPASPRTLRRLPDGRWLIATVESQLTPVRPLT